MSVRQRVASIFGRNRSKNAVLPIQPEQLQDSSAHGSEDTGDGRKQRYQGGADLTICTIYEDTVLRREDRQDGSTAHGSTDPQDEEEALTSLPGVVTRATQSAVGRGTPTNGTAVNSLTSRSSSRPSYLRQDPTLEMPLMAIIPQVFPMIPLEFIPDETTLSKLNGVWKLIDDRFKIPEHYHTLRFKNGIVTDAADKSDEIEQIGARMCWLGRLLMFSKSMDNLIIVNKSGQDVRYRKA